MLNDVGLLRVSGDLEAKKLLQGQLTCHMDEVTEVPHLGALCNPQGRVISLFYIVLQKEAYYLLMPRSMVSITETALKKYAVFYKVTLTDASDEQSILNTFLATNEPWPLMQIRAGIPSIYPETSGKFLPHELNLPELGAVSFEKGCYTGQEIIARMHYRGKLKTHLYRATIQSPTPLSPGMPIYYKQDQTQHESGTLVNACLTHAEHYEALLVTDEITAKNQHLFTTDAENYFIIQE